MFSNLAPIVQQETLLKMNTTSHSKQGLTPITGRYSVKNKALHAWTPQHSLTLKKLPPDLGECQNVFMTSIHLWLLDSKAIVKGTVCFNYWKDVLATSQPKRQNDAEVNSSYNAICSHWKSLKIPVCGLAWFRAKTLTRQGKMGPSFKKKKQLLSTCGVDWRWARTLHQLARKMPVFFFRFGFR